MGGIGDQMSVIAISLHTTFPIGCSQLALALAIGFLGITEP